MISGCSLRVSELNLIVLLIIIEVTRSYLHLHWLKVPLPWLHRHNWLLVFWQNRNFDVSFFFYLWTTLPIDWLKMMLFPATFKSYLVAMVPATFWLFENWFGFKLTWNLIIQHWSFRSKNLFQRVSFICFDDISYPFS